MYFRPLLHLAKKLCFHSDCVNAMDIPLNSKRAQNTLEPRSKESEGRMGPSVAALMKNVSSKNYMKYMLFISCEW